VFNVISIDGYFHGPEQRHELAHKQDEDWTAFASQNASGGGVLIFGRVTSC
jgi:hypothetical protein